MSRSYLTLTDQFCGAGGSSLGARAIGVEPTLALNHWQLAIETHNANFQNTAHDCCDVSAADPRRYPKTDILITSPECTNHSLAKGTKRKGIGQGDMFVPQHLDPAAERSRATMWDVPRFAEYHRYRLILVENVVDARMWELWDSWLLAMHTLGYQHKCVFLNSMFCHPTPQSRDRMYVVFWRKGNRAPKLDLLPAAHCVACGPVDAQQTWKNGRTAGRYKRQYVYTCPACRREVTPFYYAALNAIDWSLPAERIGDRKKPLKPRTMERIRYGLDKYGRRPLVIRTNMTSGVGCRVRDAATAPMDTQPGSGITGLVRPSLLHVGSRGASGAYAKSAAGPLMTQTTRQDIGVMLPSALVQTTHGDSGGRRARSTAEPVPSVTTLPDEVGVAFLAKFRGTSPSHKGALGLDKPIDTVSAGGTHAALVSHGALMTMRDAGRFTYQEPDGVLPTQVASCSQTATISREPYLVSYYGQSDASGIADSLGTVTTHDRNALIEPALDIDDCFFRMLAAHEVGAAMAFPADYIILGTSRDKVKQFGNAVTPPAMAWLLRQCVASLHPEIAA